MLESMVSGSNFGILNWDYPTRLSGNANPSYLDVSLASVFLITSTRQRQTKAQTMYQSSYRYSREIEDKLSD